MYNDPFVLNVEEYKRDINFLQHYLLDQAKNLSIMTGHSEEKCLEFVKKQLKSGGQFPFKDPIIKFLERGENGDRSEQETTLSKYFQEVTKEQHLLAPTFTVYHNAEKKPSLLAKYIEGNIAARNIAKKAMYAATAVKNYFLEAAKKVEQVARKLANNGVSGAHMSPSTPLYNPTAHSTLTTNCRCTAGYGSANNEKFLCGNRHYWCFDVTYNNVISIVRNTDYVQLEKLMSERQLHYPTVIETMACITYSTSLYWTDKRDIVKLEKLINKLTALQRAAFVYTGDLYHLMKFNESFVREFITRLSTRVSTPHANPAEIYKNSPEDHRYLAFSLCKEETKGRDLKGLEQFPEAYALVASTVENVVNTLEDYRDVIRTLWVTDNMPASVAVFPESIRRCAVTGDTDSTIFTVKDWMIWFNGKIDFSPRFNAIGPTMIFLTSQGITHILAKMSANFGIAKADLFKVAMKNEYYFPVFIPTQLGKHYFAYKEIQEGLVFEELKKEIKGVHLKNSNAPRFINEEAHKLMEYIMGTVMKGELISIGYIFNWIANLERSIYKSIADGSYDYFRRGQIKEKSGYKQGEDADPYSHYLMWTEVFAPKYGDCPAPPYMCLKISTDVDRAGLSKEWLDKMEDRELATRMDRWMKKNNKKYIKIFRIPEQIISSTGIPKEILDIVGARKMVIDVMKTFYIILDSLGMFLENKKFTKLVSDYY